MSIDNRVHIVLARSYSTYFLFLLVGVVLDTFFPIRILPNYTTWFGVGIIIWATGLVVWAQYASALLEKKKKTGLPLEDIDFHRGPYRFTRSPTHVGLAMLLVGFGCLLGSIIVIVLTGIPFLIAHFVFLQKMEDILQGKYGKLYLGYKESIKEKIL